MVDIPSDRPVYEGEIATYWFEDDGILVSLSKSTVRTVEVIKNNVALVKRITNNTPAPLLIYLARSPVPDRGQVARDHIHHRQAPRRSAIDGGPSSGAGDLL
ncbi:MAG TPA: hypothetical protein VGR57_01625 [Ktedonobacterales bacterium]|nr:hypothetical protein [Ktedonobacterales bacterium]